MELTVNGDDRTVADDSTVDSLVADVAASPKGIAVAVNGEVVPKSRWGGHALRAGDRVEVLAPHQGG